MQETQEMQVLSMHQEDALEKEVTTHSSILAWKTPWTEEPHGLQSMGLQRAGHNEAPPHPTHKGLFEHRLQHFRVIRGTV